MHIPCVYQAVLRGPRDEAIVLVRIKIAEMDS